MLKTLTAEEKQTPAVAHALRIRNALVQGNYARFFKLYQESPGKAGALTDVFIDKIRTQCLQKLAVGFIATNIDLDYLARLLAFKDTTEIEKFLTDRSKCPVCPWPPVVNLYSFAVQTASSRGKADRGAASTARQACCPCGRRPCA